LKLELLVKFQSQRKFKAKSQ